MKVSINNGVCVNALTKQWAWNGAREHGGQGQTPILGLGE
jgi:hypothetical protein